MTDDIGIEDAPVTDVTTDDDVPADEIGDGTVQDEPDLGGGA